MCTIYTSSKFGSVSTCQEATTVIPNGVIAKVNYNSPVRLQALHASGSQMMHVHISIDVYVLSSSSHVQVKKGEVIKDHPYIVLS